MSGSRAPEPALSVQGDSTTSTGDEDEDAAHGTQHSHRMLSFSDALLSIIATVMILPVTHTEISPEQFDRSIQKLLATRIAVYLMTFLIVTVAWAAHTRLFQVVGKIDDTLALLNLACMMTITFLPYTFSLMMAFPEVPLGIFLFCVCVIAIGAVQVRPPPPGLPRAASRRCQRAVRLAVPRALWAQLSWASARRWGCGVGVGCVMWGELPFAQRLHLRVFLPQRTRFPRPLLASTVPGGVRGAALWSYLLMATVIFLPYASKAASWCRGRLLGPREPPAPSVEFFTYDLQEPLSKERVEAFSDGVYAIVATLLILDICEDNVPDAKVVEERFQGSLVAALSVYGPQFLAYFGSFATVGLLWFAHHSLFLHVRKATQSMGLLNTLSLAFVGGLPLAYQQTSAFAHGADAETSETQQAVPRLYC
ncbi:PREDICTED: endosomal/lysomomal potassium channel TMEM175 [Myotis brandtii]|uniref:endosomal/lysomomal potassium channel TMEM175 n=1 Tax=Myotis brandtii TaxID=109478 RepID=UPI0007045090|nr:PREDICTED: endosomal/lysomomal potassium channel TMEM175 [Myotis brandtii]